ncbi:MAG: hypothetical protein V1882_00360 [Candidatus Omnitrophota bacterium]
MKLTKIDLINILALAGLIAVFYPALMVAREASLMGDHWEQHYPWAFLMAQSLKQGVWPFWTPLIQCGFPIVAESQIGLFYLPNLLLYTLFPIQWAYAYMNVIHFFISGTGTYVYCRRMGLSPVGALTAGIVFLFGTGYGGAYYNITSLKTLAWFPWVLWAFEEFRSSFQRRYVLFAAGLMSLSILAGYLQVAALMLLICAVYFLFRVFAYNEPDVTVGQRLKACGGMVLAALGAIVISMPQLLLSAELASFSNRVNLSEGYAYVGSLSPLAFLTILFPKLQGIFRGNCLYSGIFAIYFIFAAFFAANKLLRRTLWLWAMLGLVALLLALGGWSPLYVALIKLSHFYSFRVPAKFLIFFCFAAAVLAGLGVHVWREELVKNGERLRALNQAYLTFIAGVLALWGIVYFFVTAGLSVALQMGNWVVTHFIYGKAGHPRTLESYREAVVGIADAIRDLLSIHNPWQACAIVLIVISCFWSLFSRKVVAKSRGAAFALTVALMILVADLYVFAAADVKRDFDTYQNVLKPNRIVEILLAEKAAGKLGRIYGYRKETETLPLVPSVNMIYGIEDIGGYSPFIMSRYFETLGQFGNVNDSNQMQEPELSFVLERLPLLSALGVSHILSIREMQHPSLEFLARDPETGAFLYRNRSDLSRAHFISSPVTFFDWPSLKKTFMAPGFDPGKVLLLEGRDKDRLRNVPQDPSSRMVRLVQAITSSDRENYSVETTGPGFLVLMSVMYPGWEATVDGQKIPIISAYGLFRAVWIPGAGKHFVEFSYHPYHKLKWPGSKG